MRFASACSKSPDLEEAVGNVSSSAVDALTDRPDLGVLFVSSHHGPDLSEVAESVRERTGVQNLIGCTGESIVGNGEEIEQEPAISLWIGSLPDTSITTGHVQFKSAPDAETFTGLPANLSKLDPERTTLLLLGDPFTFPASRFLEQINNKHSGMEVIGGMASGGRTPGQNAVFIGDDERRDGAALAVLSGPVELNTIVSQGCRPIGPHYVVTKAEGNVIQELGGASALSQLQELLDDLPTVDRQLLQEGLHIGKVINEQQETFDRGDFLIRNVVGIDQESGAIQIGGPIQAGQTIQFQVRDAASADEDLRELLDGIDQNAGAPPKSALLFTCNGRGTRLFEEQHHDAGLLKETFGDIPISGFFAQGEIGPIGGSNFIHGYTACITLFRQLDRE